MSAQQQAAPVIGLIGVGDMGAGVAAALVAAGFPVISDLAPRSAHSRGLAAAAGVQDAGSLAALLTAADIVLSIVPPAAAPSVAAAVAAQAPAPGSFLFADCNAVAPARMAAIAGQLEPLGIAVVDVGIVGSPPAREPERGTRFYVSGAERQPLLALHIPGIDWHDLGPEPGRASALKMMYAAINKGVDALLLAVLLGAGRLGVREPLLAELAASQALLDARMRRRLPFLAATAARFAPEMQEIEATLAAAGVTGDLHAGAAWVYARLAESSLAAETRATLPAARELQSALAEFDTALAAHLARPRA